MKVYLISILLFMTMPLLAQDLSQTGDEWGKLKQDLAKVRKENAHLRKKINQLQKDLSGQTQTINALSKQLDSTGPILDSLKAELSRADEQIRAQQENLTSKIRRDVRLGMIVLAALIFVLVLLWFSHNHRHKKEKLCSEECLEKLRSEVDTRIYTVENKLSLRINELESRNS